MNPDVITDQLSENENKILVYFTCQTLREWKRINFSERLITYFKTANVVRVTMKQKSDIIQPIYVSQCRASI